MRERPVGDPLRVLTEFPFITTAEWDAAIRATAAERPSQYGIALPPFYRREDLEALGALADLAPGQFPYTRGTGAAWHIREDGADVQEQGATPVEQLAFVLAEAVEKLSTAIDNGETVDAAASAMEFHFTVGSNFFLEIGKLRAARTLWATAVAAFGPEDIRCATVRIHARTTRFDGSHGDPYANLLRATTAALSAVIGGCDTLLVAPDGFDPHLALNVHRILREECYVDRVLDPAGGSYYIEVLTDALARAAWQRFQELEQAGGWSAAVQSGFVTL